MFILYLNVGYLLAFITLLITLIGELRQSRSSSLRKFLLMRAESPRPFISSFRLLVLNLKRGNIVEDPLSLFPVVHCQEARFFLAIAIPTRVVGGTISKVKRDLVYIYRVLTFLLRWLRVHLHAPCRGTTVKVLLYLRSVLLLFLLAILLVSLSLFLAQ